MRKILGTSGFSLIELMVVVAIIGILSMIALPAYINHIYRVRENSGVERLLDLQLAQEKFHALNDTYALDPTAANFRPLLSFDPTDVSMYVFTVAAPAAPGIIADNYVARVQADLNQDGTFSNCWSVTASPATPILDTATVGCTNSEGFSLSLVTSIF